MIRSAQEYHRATSYDRSRMSGHFLDWPNQPNVFKTYTGLRTIPLPEPPEKADTKLSALLLEKPTDAPETLVDMAALSRILHLTHAITAKTRHGATDFYFRSVASAGALYPAELYVAAWAMKDLEDGLYHHTLGYNALTLLRKGNVREALGDAIGMQREAPPCLIFFLTAMFFRSSWKYRDRAYRYHLLDTGHMVENLALALREARLPFSVHYDFDDDLINRMLCVDGSREVCLAAIPAWATNVSAETERVSLALPQHDLTEESRCARRETDYPAIGEIHSASSHAAKVVEEFPNMVDTLGPQTGPARPIVVPDVSTELMTYPESVFKRRSMRNFVEQDIPAEAFAMLLSMLSSKSMAESHAEPSSNHAAVVGFLASNVSGFDPGLYLLDTYRQNVRPAFMGRMTGHMAHVCLDQAWLENCAVHFLFLSNLGLLERTYGPRGYRHALLAAGRLGQRLYLAATAMRLGCCGIGAFYDKEAAGILALNEESALLYLLGAGPTRKWYVR